MLRELPTVCLPFLGQRDRHWPWICCDYLFHKGGKGGLRLKNCRRLWKLPKDHQYNDIMSNWACMIYQKWWQWDTAFVVHFLSDFNSRSQWLTGIVGFKCRLSPSSCLLFVSGKSTRVILSSYHPRWSALWAFGWPGFTFPHNQVLFRRSFSIEPQSRSQRAKRGKEFRKIFSWETQLLERCKAS